MGNCVETCTQRQEEEDQMQQQQQQQHHEQEDDEREQEIRFVKESNNLGKDGNMRIKIVLTKEELEWLMLQLKDKGGKSLENVLEEIQKGRAKVVEEGWKPSLESIMECPEVIEMDR